MDASLSVSPTPPPDPRRRRRFLHSAISVPIVAVLLIWSWRGTQFSLEALANGSPQLLDFAQRLFPPATDGKLMVNVVQAAAVTLQIALLGTALGAAVALVLGLLAANNLTPEWVHHPMKMVLSTLRSVPVVILALLFVSALGLGAFPGVMAIAVHSIGMLGKLYAEECETAYAGVWEAMDSAGATWLQKIRYAIWPQVAPQFASLTLFRLEMNIRDSAVLGLVGVMGLGFWLDLYRRSFEYPRVGTLLLVTIAIVLVVDFLSQQLRKRLT